MDVLTTTPLPVAEWLAVIEDEYLRRFVPEGGAAVKFALLDEASVGEVAGRLAGLGAAHAMLTVAVDAGQVRVNLMHELLFAITRALPWEALLQAYVEALFTANAYPWPRPGVALPMTELAAQFGVAPALLTRQRDQWLTADLWDDRRLAQDFRAAMLRLCLSRLEPGETGMAAPVMHWLRGEKVPVGGAARGRHLRRASRGPTRQGHAGIAAAISCARPAAAGAAAGAGRAAALANGGAADGVLRYSPAAVMDAFEVLREVIDDAEHLPGLFTAVLADAALATGDPRRALNQYAALQMRVWPDVRPGDRQNPVAPLVWLAA